MLDVSNKKDEKELDSLVDIDHKGLARGKAPHGTQVLFFYLFMVDKDHKLFENPICPAHKNPPGGCKLNINRENEKERRTRTIFCLTTSPKKTSLGLEIEAKDRLTILTTLTKGSNVWVCETRNYATCPPP